MFHPFDIRLSYFILSTTIDINCPTFSLHLVEISASKYWLRLEIDDFL